MFSSLCSIALAIYVKDLAADVRDKNKLIVIAILTIVCVLLPAILTLFVLNKRVQSRAVMEREAMKQAMRLMKQDQKQRIVKQKKVRRSQAHTAMMTPHDRERGGERSDSNAQQNQRGSRMKRRTNPINLNTTNPSTFPFPLNNAQ